MITTQSIWDDQLVEILGIINCYFFNFSRALECFRCYSQILTHIHSFLSMKRDSPPIIDITLRIIKNELASGFVIDLEDQFIEDLEKVMTTKARVVIIAQIISQICHSSSDNRLKSILSTKKDTIIKTLAL